MGLLRSEWPEVTAPWGQSQVHGFSGDVGHPPDLSWNTEQSLMRVRVRASSENHCGAMKVKGPVQGPKLGSQGLSSPPRVHHGPIWGRMSPVGPRCSHAVGWVGLEITPASCLFCPQSTLYSFPRLSHKFHSLKHAIYVPLSSGPCVPVFVVLIMVQPNLNMSLLCH